MQVGSLFITIFLVILVITLPRKWVLWPFALAACVIPADQRILIFDLDFTSIRFCVLAGMIRLFVQGELRPIQWNRFDKLVLAWSMTGAIIYAAQYGGEMQAIVYKCGVLYDCLGLYWIFRQTLRDFGDISRLFWVFAVCAIISCPLIVLERITQHSPYSVLGHAPAGLHHGRFRCSGPFPHYIIMGLFWVTLVPIFGAYMVTHKNKLLFATASAASLICIQLCASSTPLMALFAVIVFSFLYKVRDHGKTFAIIGVSFILGLHLMMAKPVWHLVCRVNVFSGSTGWHRYILFDRFVKNVNEWFVLGCRGVEHWGIHAGDITNQYVLEGVRGGFITLVLFLIVLIQAVKTTWLASLKLSPKQVRIAFWGICLSVLGHCVAFWGVSYFGQINMLLYMTFAIVGLLNDKSMGLLNGKR